MILIAAALVIALAAAAVARGLDVRLVLLLAAFALAGLAGDTTIVVREFLATFSNERFVVPICTAMGFAYVLRHTGCDQHLVQLLVKPLRHGKNFLVPGVVLVGFLVNIPVISQTSTAVCMGAVVVPLMRAARLTPVTIGATLLLGASIGGELLNPGAPELNTVAERLRRPSTDVVPAVVPLLFPHLVFTVLLFWIVCARAERRAAQSPSAPETVERPGPDFRINVFRAIVPLVPLVLLFVTSPPLSLVRVPDAWLVSTKPLASAGEVAGGAVYLLRKTDPAYASRLIGAAMLAGVGVAALANLRQAGGVMASFFEGAGSAFAQIISLIVTANCFGKAVEQVGVAQLLGELVSLVPSVLVPVAALVPLSFAVLSGSGMAATQSLYPFFVPISESVGVDPLSLGGVVSTSAAAGRTMSPVAAVVLMSARLSGAHPFALARRVAGPLLASLGAVILLRTLRVI